MAADFPADLRYSDSDEWVRLDGDEATVGVTAFASEQLGDVVYLQLPDVGSEVRRGQAFGEIESVKAVSDLNSPLTGTVTGVNDELDQNPGLVNEEPYGRGWIIKIQPNDRQEYESLLDARAYEQSTTERH